MRTYLAALLLAAAACAPAPAGLSEADRQAIDAQRETFRQAFEAADFAKAIAVYTDDAAVMPPNAPLVHGQSAIEALFGAFPPVGDFRLTATEATGGSDVAMVRGTYSMNVMPPGATMAVADSGKFVELWRKQADGSWRLAWDIWNSNLPLPGSPPPAAETHQH